VFKGHFKTEMDGLDILGAYMIALITNKMLLIFSKHTEKVRNLYRQGDDTIQSL